MAEFERLESFINSLTEPGGSDFINREAEDTDVSFGEPMSFRQELEQRIADQKTPVDLALLIQRTQVRLTTFTEKVYSFYREGENPGNPGCPNIRRFCTI